MMEEYEDKKKDIAAQINDSFSEFCAENDIKEKGLFKQAIRQYFKFRKDKNKFYESSGILDQYLDLLTTELPK